MNRLKASAALICTLLIAWSQIIQPYCAYALSAQSVASSQSLQQSSNDCGFQGESSQDGQGDDSGSQGVTPSGMVTMRTLLVRMGAQAQFLMISLESGQMSRTLTILLARPRRMIPCRRILLKLTLWNRIPGVMRTACLLMLSPMASMHSLWLTKLCPMVPLRVVSMSATFRGRLTGIRLKPLE